MGAVPLIRFVLCAGFVHIGVQSRFDTGSLNARARVWAQVLHAK